jgi:hypothetical protein
MKVGVMKVLFVCMTTMCLVSAASADSASPAISNQVKPVTSFGYLDIDKDERLSQQEAKVDWAVAQRFEGADLNRDGYLDADEFKRLSRG